MTIYTEQDLYNYVVPKPCTKRVPILPFVTGAGVLGGLGTGIGGITTSTQFYYKLSQELNGDMEWVANSLVTLQDQLNFLAAVVLQNQRVLDLLTAKRGETCLFLGEESSYYVNQSGIVTEKVKEIRDRIQRRAEELQNTRPWDLLSQWVSWILPFLGPLAVIILLLLFGPCIFNLLVKFVSSRIEAVKLQMVLQMEPQMQSMTKIYCGPLDRSASPCSNVDDIQGTPPEEISTAQLLLCPNSAGSS
ncbi:syncytin-1-like [Gorilla gorilla gorilla]|uniref:syncytin-1-like n=1 Tax=Gorilla gorilla gorilla TaxID=9595 RepID=UPI00300A5860